jgi:hypothetical protein
MGGLDVGREADAERLLHDGSTRAERLDMGGVAIDLGRRFTRAGIGAEARRRGAHRGHGPGAEPHHQLAPTANASVAEC